MSVWASEPIWMDLHGSRTLKVPGLKRVAVANGKILKVRTLPQALLLTGRKAGSTTVRAWGVGGEQVWRVHVVKTAPLVPVVGVKLEFLEWQGQSANRRGVRFPTRITGDLKGAWTGPTGGAWRFQGAVQSPQVWIEAMVAQGKARLVAEPSLFVKVGEQATFQAGGEIPVATTQSSGGTVFTRVEWKAYGLSAKVRPQTVDSIHLSTEVELEVSEPLGEGGSADSPPALHRRSLTTHVLSEDGETVLLTLLQKHTDQRSHEGVLGLGSLPVVGPLFGTRAAQTQDNALLVSLTLNLSTDGYPTRSQWEKRWSDENP